MLVIIQHTPLWVFARLALLVWLGVLVLRATLTPWNLGVSGPSAGHVLGRIVRFALTYRAARQPEAAAV